MVTEYISKSWKVYKKNAASFVASELVAGILPGIIIALGLILFLVSVIPTLNWEMVINTTDEQVLTEYFLGLFQNTGFVNSLISGILYFFVFLFLGLLLSLYLGIGQFGMAYESLSKKTKLKTMFKVSRKMGFRWIMTNLILFFFAMILIIPILLIAIFTFGIGFGLVLLIFPVLSLIPPAMVVSDLSSTESIGKAFKVAKKNYLNLFVLWLIYVIGILVVSFVGTLFSYVPVVGGLVNLVVNLFLTFAIRPMMRISFVNFYKRNKR